MIADAQAQGLPEIELITFGRTVPEELHLRVYNEWCDFLQGFYTALNQYAHVIDAICDHEFRRGLKLGSMETWLHEMRKRFPELESAIDVVESARSFRARYVDHRGRQKAYDWMTVGALVDGEYMIVPLWFIPIFVPVDVDIDALTPEDERPASDDGDADADAPAADHTHSMTPWDDGFVPPIACSEYGVPPAYTDVLDAFRVFVFETSKRFGLGWTIDAE
jgi:hypothetical protein